MPFVVSGQEHTGFEVADNMAGSLAASIADTGDVHDGSLGCRNRSFIHAANYGAPLAAKRQSAFRLMSARSRHY